VVLVLSGELDSVEKTGRQINPRPLGRILLWQQLKKGVPERGSPEGVPSGTIKWPRRNQGGGERQKRGKEIKTIGNPLGSSDKGKAT